MDEAREGDESETGARSWVFCQLGGREHYVLPRGLHARGLLKALVTDAWAPPGRPIGRLSPRLKDRYSAGLESAHVVDFTRGLLAFEAMRRIRRVPAGWPEVIARNDWFQRRAVTAIRRRNLLAGQPVVFAYSYAARAILREARAAGCRTVLGQIDPATTEEDIVADAVQRHAALRPSWERAPASYWESWREECELADRIVVNSEWSREGLIEAGVDAAKLRVVPLAYAPGAVGAVRNATQFSFERPLRLLFLGSANVRKGIGELLDAMQLLADVPVELHVVGPVSIQVPEAARANPRILFHGPVVRSDAAAHYARADAFILPTHSDGFALTQIEAQAAGLPLIASRHCADVAGPRGSGLLLPEVSAPAIAAAVRRLLDQPAQLAAMSEAALARSGDFAERQVISELIAAAR